MALWRKLLIGSLGGVAFVAALAAGLNHADRAYPPPVDVADIVSR